MYTYSWEQLDEHAQAYAEQLYTDAELVDGSWRFSANGERVA